MFLCLLNDNLLIEELGVFGTVAWKKISEYFAAFQAETDRIL